MAMPPYLPPGGNTPDSRRSYSEVAELVEDEQRMIAGAFVMAVPGAYLLFAGWD
jgi:hypothetical protein